MGQIGRISLIFTMSIVRMDFLSVVVKNAAIGAEDGFNTWMPFGTWSSNAIASGRPSLLSDYWQEPRSGRWFWHAGDPDSADINLSVDDTYLFAARDVVGTIEGFPRHKFETGNRSRLEGTWASDKDDWADRFIWTAGSFYDFT